MKKIDEFGLGLCKAQAKLFVDSLSYVKCSSPVFLRRFMNSLVAKRMDEGSFLFESSTSESIFTEIEEEFGEIEYGKNKFSDNEMYWMGYLYRYWCYTFEKTSKQVYQIIKPTELRELYYPYHSLDCQAAIERILEAKGVSSEDYTVRGVEILRNLQTQKIQNSSSRP